MTSTDVNVYLKNLSFWNHISDDDKRLIIDKLHLLHYEAGQSVHSGEDECLGALIIRRGILRTFLLSERNHHVQTQGRQHLYSVSILHPFRHHL